MAQISYRQPTLAAPISYHNGGFFVNQLELA